MKKLVLKTAMAATFALLAGSASAAITVSQSPYYNYAADLVAFSNTNVICDFDGASDCIAGYNLSFGGGGAPGTGIYNGSAAGITAMPPGDTTDYLSILGPNGFATLTFNTGITNLSFFMGSPDQYNSIDFFGPGSTFLQGFDGSMFTGPPANGDQSLGERITFSFNGANVTEVRFGSTQNSFELDRIGATAVPEPATWAMMLIGFGGLGAVLRFRRGQAALAA